MALLQQEYGDDPEIMLLSHSVMPRYDFVSVLKLYAKVNGANTAKWNLVTGNKDSIYHIARDGYFADEEFNQSQNQQTLSIQKILSWRIKKDTLEVYTMAHYRLIWSD